MPYGPGTYGSKRGRPPAKKKASAGKKKMSAGQKMIASQAGNRMKIEAADFKKLRKGKR
tara:strand:- start:6 stop:182 length:177 start_codon:yes stop_codon:yes gene_type:complete